MDLVSDVKEGDKSFKTVSIAMNAKMIQPDKNGEVKPDKKRCVLYYYNPDVLKADVIYHQIIQMI